MKIQVYNSSECIVFSGSEEEYQELKANHLINDSDRVIFIK